jgi:hypothetical protein
MYDTYVRVVYVYMSVRHDVIIDAVLLVSQLPYAVPYYDCAVL